MKAKAKKMLEGHRFKTLRDIEKAWTGHMANEMEERVRFAMWDAMRLAATMAGFAGRARILAELKRDTDLFDKYGLVQVKPAP